MTRLSKIQSLSVKRKEKERKTSKVPYHLREDNDCVSRSRMKELKYLLSIKMYGERDVDTHQFPKKEEFTQSSEQCGGAADMVYR